MAIKDKLNFKKQKKNLKPPKTKEPPQEERGYSYELTPGQILFRTFGFVIVLAWVFILGVVVGRGLPLVDAEEDSVQAQFIRFLGLARKPPEPVENAARTWEAPEDREMLAKLRYHEELQQEERPDISFEPFEKEPEKPVKETASAEPETDTPEPVDAQETEELSEKEEAPETDDSGSFILMVASMRTYEYAENLVKKLEGKGYAPRLQTVQGSGGRPWHRVMIGPFETQSKALKFAAEFNSKENMQGLVVRTE